MNARAATRSYLSANGRVGSSAHRRHRVRRRGTFISAGARPLMCIPCKYYPRPARHRVYTIYTYATAHSLAVAATVPKLIGRNRPPVLCSRCSIHAYYMNRRVSVSPGWNNKSLLIHWLPKKKKKKKNQGKKKKTTKPKKKMRKSKKLEKKKKKKKTFSQNFWIVTRSATNNLHYMARKPEAVCSYNTTAAAGILLQYCRYLSYYRYIMATSSAILIHGHRLLSLY